MERPNQNNGLDNALTLVTYALAKQARRRLRGLYMSAGMDEAACNDDTTGGK